MTLHDAALAFHDSGCCVVPARPDGSKAPAAFWKQYMTAPPRRDQIAAWTSNGAYDGIGLVCGKVSGNLEMFELEGRAVTELLDRLTAAITDNDLNDLWKRLNDGYLELTPSGGLHWLYRVNGTTRGNLKLARRPATTAELATNPDQKIYTLIETRGEGGYVITAPSAGRTHPSSKAWTALVGDPATIPLISEDERDALHAVATLLDQMPAETLPAETWGNQNTATYDGTGARPGDDYNQKATWTDILEPHGWRITRRLTGGGLGWCRPGKTGTVISATTGTSADGADRLYVFSTSTIFDTEKPYSKFAAHTHLEHGGNYSTAAKELRRQGYGGPAPKPDSDLCELAGPDTDEPAPDQPDTEMTRPEFDVTLPADAADWLRDNTGTGRLAGMFNRTGDIVHTPRENEDGYVPLTGDDDDTDGPAQVRPVTASALAARMTYMYWCYRRAGPKDDPVKVHATFPAAAAKIPVDVPDMLPNLRRLRGVTHTPILRRDGTMLTAPGYDQASGLLHLPEPGFDMPPVPDTPTTTQLGAAVALIHEMVAGFPFVTDHHKANYLGALLTPLLRQITPPPYKLTAITAPQPGSGKTLLATVNRIIHGGVFRAEMPEDDAELRKQISAILDVTTGPVIHIDNVTGVLRSSTLSGLLTSPQWDDRRLGSNEMISRRNDRLWMITGNNIAIGGDLPRRTIPVEIDPGVPNPERRTGFAITDLETWVRDRRGELLAALLTFARAWIIAGKPLGGQAGSDSYTTWVRTIRGILAHAGMPGVFDHDDTRLDVGTDDDDWHNFLAAAQAAFGEGTWSVKELLAKVDTGDDTARFADDSEIVRQWKAAHPIPLDALPADLADKAARSKAGLSVIGKSLGRWLANRDGRWAGDLSVRQAGQNAHDKIKLWRVQRYEPAGFAVFAGSNFLTAREDLQINTVQTGLGERSTENGHERGPETDPAKPANPARAACPPWTPKTPGEVCLTCGATADLCSASTIQEEIPT